LGLQPSSDTSMKATLFGPQDRANPYPVTEIGE